MKAYRFFQGWFAVFATVAFILLTATANAQVTGTPVDCPAGVNAISCFEKVGQDAVTGLTYDNPCTAEAETITLSGSTDYRAVFGSFTDPTDPSLQVVMLLKGSINTKLRGTDQFAAKYMFSQQTRTNGKFTLPYSMSDKTKVVEAGEGREFFIITTTEVHNDGSVKVRLNPSPSCDE